MLRRPATAPPSRSDCCLLCMDVIVIRLTDRGPKLRYSFWRRRLFKQRKCEQNASGDAKYGAGNDPRRRRILQNAQYIQSPVNHHRDQGYRTYRRDPFAQAFYGHTISPNQHPQQRPRRKSEINTDIPMADGPCRPEPVRRAIGQLMAYHRKCCHQALLHGRTYKRGQCRQYGQHQERQDQERSSPYSNPTSTCRCIVHRFLIPLRGVLVKSVAIRWNRYEKSGVPPVCERR